MNGDVEELVREGLDRLTADVRVPAEMVARARTRVRRRKIAARAALACGTAAVITPVGQVKSASGEWMIGDGTPGPVTLRLREELVGIQYGHKPDPFNWIHKVC